jgi:hypothetical protein
MMSARSTITTVAVAFGLLFATAGALAQGHFEDAMQPEQLPGAAFVYPGDVGHDAAVTISDGVVAIHGASSTHPTYVADSYNYLRAGVTRPEADYQNFAVSVDLVGSQSPPMNPGDPIQGFAVFGRGASADGDRANYYALELVPNADAQGQAKLALKVVYDGVVSELLVRRVGSGALTTEQSVTVDPSGAYQLTLVGVGQDLMGELVNLENGAAIASVVGRDDRLTHGTVGFLAYDHQGLMGNPFGRINVQFANFDATGTPPQYENGNGGEPPPERFVASGFGGFSEVSGQFELRADAIAPSAVGGRAHTFSVLDTETECYIQPGQPLTISAKLLGGNQDNALAGVGVKDTTGRGYVFSMDENELRVIKTLGDRAEGFGESAVFYWESAHSVPNENVTMEMTLSVDGANVQIDVRVLDAQSASENVLFETSVTDTPGDDSIMFNRGGGWLVSSPDGVPNYHGLSLMPELSLDHFDLAEDSADSMDASRVTFDNLTVTVADMPAPPDPNEPEPIEVNTGEPSPVSENSLRDWTWNSDLAASGKGIQLSTEVALTAYPLAGRDAYGRDHTIAVQKAGDADILQLGPETAITLTVELVKANQDNAVAGIGFLPIGGAEGYFFSKDENELHITKGVAPGTGQALFSDDMTNVANDNVVLSLTLEGEADGIGITAQVLDPTGQVLFERHEHDTLGARYSTQMGRLVLFLNHADRTPDDAPLMPASEVIFDNAQAGSIGEPLPMTGNTP